LTLLKWIAEAAKFGEGVVYVVVDGSGDFALKPGTCF
jgi:hypothetical protein